MAALIGFIHTNAQIYFHTSDVLSCSENCLHQFRTIKVFRDASAFNRSRDRASGQTQRAVKVSVREFVHLIRTAFHTPEMKAYLK